jgi:predicted Zn-dependent peptidase
MPLLKMDYQTHILPNGIKLIHKQTDSPVAHCGIIISTGSRDEKTEEHGMVHFIEHLLFKGTKKRKSYNILSRMEDVGGEINAYTTKEDTCIYSTFFSNYYPRALELISDIVFNSDFPEKEIEKEKEVIIDEINSYRDTPSEMIFDEFEELIFRNNPIGRNILGDKKKLKAFTRDDILSFVKSGYCTDQMVLSSVGNIAFNRLIKHFERYFGNIPAKPVIRKRIKYSGYSPVYREMNYNTHQSHCVIGNVAYNIKNEKRLILNLLNNLLGGPGLNSRLSMSLREKQGFVYNIDSSYTPYSDTGIVSIYFGTDKADVNISIKTVHAELRKLKMKPLTGSQLAKAKRQILGQIAISLENNENLMLAMGKSFLIFNRVDSLEEISAKYNSITAKDLLDVANDIFNKDSLSYLIYK